MRDDWSAARRLVSAFHCGAVHNFVAVVDEIDTAGRWEAVALALVGEVAAMANQYADQQPKISWTSDWQLRSIAIGRQGNPEVNPRCYRIEWFSIARGR